MEALHRKLQSMIPQLQASPTFNQPPLLTRRQLRSIGCRWIHAFVTPRVRATTARTCAESHRIRAYLHPTALPPRAFQLESIIGHRVYRLLTRGLETFSTAIHRHEHFCTVRFLGLGPRSTKLGELSRALRSTSGKTREVQSTRCPMGSC